MRLPPGAHYTHNVDIVAYDDLAGRPGFKLAIQEVQGRWYLYMGHLWHRGWSIVEITDPAAPQLLRFLEGPTNTWTIQVQVAEGRMVTALERIPPGWGGQPDPAAPSGEGVLIWDVGDPADPRLLGHFRTGGGGTHRNYYDGGRYIHCASAIGGYEGHIYQIVDISDAKGPREAGRWWVPGQHPGDPAREAPPGTMLHAPYVAGERAYLAYGAAGLIILDIVDVASPQPIARLDFAPPFQSVIAGHTAMPLPGRGLVAVNSEAIAEECREPLGFAGLVDVADEAQPTLVSLFPLPAPPPESPWPNFCARGGRFGPHNLHQPQRRPELLQDENLALLTYFNAGLRVIDIADARLPREVGYFVPPDPARRRGTLPATLAAQSEDVTADARGYIYVTDKNHGLYVLRFTG